MKYKMSLLMVLVPVLAQAEIITVKSSLWAVPFENRISANLISVDQKLQKVCDNYQRLLIASDGTINNPYPSFLSSIRSQPEGATTAQSFQTVFKISLDRSLRTTTINAPKNEGFPLSIANLQSSLSRLEMDTVTLGAMNVSKSKYIAISDQQGLPRGTYKLLQTGRDASIQVNTKDVACDLLAGNVSFSMSAYSNVIPTSEDQKSLDGFYEIVQNQVLDVLQSTESDQKKSIRIGFRLGGIISPSSGYSADAESSILGLFSVLFDDNTLNKSKAWSTFDGGSKLLVSGSYSETKTFITVSN